ncbi:MAG: hypothetical protein ACYYKD_12550 [Rhodospirillales bacterium]
MIFSPHTRKSTARLALALGCAGLALLLLLSPAPAPALAAEPAAEPAAEQVPKLAVPPVLGLEDAPAAALAEAMAEALARRGLAVEAKTAGGDFVIAGRARVIERRETAVWAEILWTVKAPGKPARDTGKHRIFADQARWAAGEALTMRYAAAETGKDVFGILAQMGLKIGPEAGETPESAPESAPAPEPAPEAEPEPAPARAAWPGAPVFLVLRVYGAPGGGDEDLTQAMRRALAGRGAKIAADADQATHIVQGAVNMSAVFAGTQRARIIWRVTTAAGAPVGTAAQENDITAGAMDGPWEGMADDIALSAADGVRRLFEQ